MMETVHVIQRNYERTLSYGKEETNDTFIRKDERSSKAEKDGLYLIHDGIIIRIYEMARSVDAILQEGMAVSFACGSAERFKESTIQIFLGVF